MNARPAVAGRSNGPGAPRSEGPAGPAARARRRWSGSPSRWSGKPDGPAAREDGGVPRRHLVEAGRFVPFDEHRPRRPASRQAHAHVAVGAGAAQPRLGTWYVGCRRRRRNGGGVGPRRSDGALRMLWRRPAGSAGARSGPRASRSSRHLEAGAMLLLFGLLHRGPGCSARPRSARRTPPAGRARTATPPTASACRHDLGIPLRGRFRGGHRVRLAGHEGVPALSRRERPAHRSGCPGRATPPARRGPGRPRGRSAPHRTGGTGSRPRTADLDAPDARRRARVDIDDEPAVRRRRPGRGVVDLVGRHPCFPAGVGRGPPPPRRGGRGGRAPPSRPRRGTAPSRSAG